MGGSAGYQKSSSSSQSSSESKLSSLALKQEDVLDFREDFFRNKYLPEFQSLYESLNPDSAAGKAQMGLTAKEINSSFNAAQKQTNQALAQQNLNGSGAGLALLAYNNRARSSALANAYANNMAKSNENKMTALTTLGGLMPQTTTAAPTVQKSQSTSKSSSSGFSAGIG